MADLLIEFPPEQSEIVPSLRKALGDQFTIVKPDRFGGAHLIQVIIPLIGPVAGALAKILTSYFTSADAGKKDKKVLYDGKVLYMENYSEAEVAKLLGELISKQ